MKHSELRRGSKYDATDGGRRGSTVASNGMATPWDDDEDGGRGCHNLADPAGPGSLQSALRSAADRWRSGGVEGGGGS